MSGHVHCCDEVDAEAAWGAGYNAGRFDREAEARAEPRAEGLDVERLARALHAVSIGCEYPGRTSRADDIYHRGHAAMIAREYAALEEPPT